MSYVLWKPPAAKFKMFVFLCLFGPELYRVKIYLKSLHIFRYSRKNLTNLNSLPNGFFTKKCLPYIAANDRGLHIARFFLDVNALKHSVWNWVLCSCSMREKSILHICVYHCVPIDVSNEILLLIQKLHLVSFMFSNHKKICIAHYILLNIP